MRRIIGQFPIKAGRRDAHVGPWDLAEAICHLLLMAYHQNLTHL